MHPIQKKLHQELNKSLDKIGPGKMVIDRNNTDSFVNVARDSFYTYEKNVLLCERFYRFQRCFEKEIIMAVPDPKEMDKLQESLFSYKEKKLTKKELHEQFNRYNEAMKSMPMIQKEMKVWFYKPPHENEEYMLTEYKKNPSFLSQQSTYVMTYFMTHQPFIITTSDSPFEVVTVEDDDYIDVVTVLKKTVS